MRDTMFLDETMPVRPGMYLCAYTKHGKMTPLIFGPMRIRKVTPNHRGGRRIGWRFFPADRNTAPLILPDGCEVEVMVPDEDDHPTPPSHIHLGMWPNQRRAYERRGQI